jgi:hypothetical protein
VKDFLSQLCVEARGKCTVREASVNRKLTAYSRGEAAAGNEKEKSKHITASIKV